MKINYRIKRYLVRKDFFRRVDFLKKEKKLFLYKIIYKYNICKKINYKFKKNVYFTRIKNRCMYTGKTGFPLRTFRLSRICFREIASFGTITSVKKSS